MTLFLTPSCRSEPSEFEPSTCGYTLETAEEEISSGRADLVSFGTQFLANPDLPERFATGAALNAPNPATFYSGGALGYTDYPALAASTPP